eukprot:827036-Rhodomonas_salina.2
MSKNKCAGTQNIAEALTKSLSAPSFLKHREHLFGSRIPFEAFRVSIGVAPSSAGAAWTALQCSRIAAAA